MKKYENFETSNNSGLENNRQTSFFVDLQETATSNQTQKKKATEDPLIKSQKKRSLFSKIFGLKEKDEKNKVIIQEVKNEESSEDEFKKEMREVIEDNLNKTDQKDNEEFQKNNSQNNDVIISEPNQIDDNITEFESQRSQNELDDDLLQIPAFLRRQAN